MFDYLSVVVYRFLICFMFLCNKRFIEEFLDDAALYVIGIQKLQNYLLHLLDYICTY